MQGNLHGEAPAVRTLDDKAQSLQALLSKDRQTLLVYSTVWCERCRKERPHVEEWAKRHTGQVTVISIVSGAPPARVREMLSKYKLQVKHSPMVVDASGALAEHHGVHATPTLILLGQDGTEVGRYGSIEKVPLPKTQAPPAPKATRVEIEDKGRILGTSFHVIVSARPGREDAARAAIASGKDKVARLEKALSEWRPDSEISQVNQLAAKQTVAIGRDLRTILIGAQHVAKLTHGAFDITWRPLGVMWDAAAKAGVWPTQAAIDSARVGVGRAHLKVAPDGVRFGHAATKLGIAGVAKGYIIDAWFLHLVRAGFKRVIVNIGGDLRTIGKTVSGAPRSLLIADPYAPTKRFIGRLEVDAAAVATSGNYWRAREFKTATGSRRAGHILDPRTGSPATFDGSVTVLTTDSAMADALATGLFVLGPKRGLALARSIAGVDAVYATRTGLQATVNVKLKPLAAP